MPKEKNNIEKSKITDIKVITSPIIKDGTIWLANEKSKLYAISHIKWSYDGKRDN
jgi:hypothetical protein